jgi:DNA-binding FadR family transcriptional regulator
MDLPSIKTANLQEIAKEKLKLYILDANLKAGDLLPTEKQLSEQFGISRTVLRESLKGLQAVGMIGVKHGIGYFVQDFNIESILGNLPYMLEMRISKFRDILELRIVLESHYIAKLASSYTDEDIGRLRGILSQLERISIRGHGDPELITVHTQFHCELYRRTGNSLLDSLIKIFSTIQRNLTVLHRYESRDEEFISLHQNLVQALSAHDPRAARERLLVHFREAIAWVRENSQEAMWI